MGLMSSPLRRRRSQQSHIANADDWRPSTSLLLSGSSPASAGSGPGVLASRFTEQQQQHGGATNGPSASLSSSSASGWESSSSLNQAIIDSAYGTLDEADSDDSVSLWRRNTIKGQHYRLPQQQRSGALAATVAGSSASAAVLCSADTVSAGSSAALTSSLTTGLTRRGSRKRTSGTRSHSVGDDDVFLWSRQHQLHQQRSRSSSLGRGTGNGTGGSASSSDVDPSDRTRDSLISFVDEDYGESRLYSQEHSFDSVESFQSTASSCYRSSPEPSEYEFDVARLTPVRKRSKRLARISTESSLSSTGGTTSLSRRHTLPRRRERVRAPTVSVSIVSAFPADAVSRTSASASVASPLIELLPKPLPPLASMAASLSLVLSLASCVSPVPLLPSSPVHVLHPGDHAAVEYINAALSPLLISGVTPAAALAVANFASLASIEMTSSASIEAKVALCATLWGAIISLRVLLSFFFGRALGWAHPQWFSTRAIHEVGAGTAPILLALTIIHAFASRRRTSGSVSLFRLGLLAANFSTPIEQGGSGFWLGFSAIVISVLVCAGLFAWDLLISIAASPPATKRRTNAAKVSRGHLAATYAALLLIPTLASISGSAGTFKTSSASLDSAFSQLHLDQPHLLTILLMTAPRPGNPDFLLRTIESWLDGLPQPGTPGNVGSTSGNMSVSSGRVRLLVYTHFQTHTMFDIARDYFAASPAHAAKAAHYLRWHRDPRSADRLDQRLHVARGLHLAATEGGSSAYVMLAEDDFPLCPDDPSTLVRGSRIKPTWNSAWNELQRVLVATNEAMPDLPRFEGGTSRAPMTTLEQEATSGHCGVFIATGGSGLAIRGFIAAKLPALLLGEDDPHGDDRDARASRGEFSVKHEDEGADTPDLVIQDCLRGRIAGCEVCSAPDASSSPATIARSTRRYPEGSARNPFGITGDRWGKSGLTGSPRLVQHHLGYNASTLPGRRYGKEEWACGWRQPFNGEPDVLTL